MDGSFYMIRLMLVYFMVDRLICSIFGNFILSLDGGDCIVMVGDVTIYVWGLYSVHSWGDDCVWIGFRDIHVINSNNSSGEIIAIRPSSAILRLDIWNSRRVVVSMGS